MQEREYNPYYAFLGQKLCEFKRSHQVRNWPYLVISQCIYDCNSMQAPQIRIHSFYIILLQFL